MRSSGSLIIFERESGPDLYQLRFTENGLEFVFKTPMMYDLMNYRLILPDSVAFVNALENNFNAPTGKLMMNKFERFENIYFKTIPTAVRLIDRSELNCSRTCGEGQKTVFKGHRRRFVRLYEMVHDSGQGLICFHIIFRSS